MKGFIILASLNCALLALKGYRATFVTKTTVYKNIPSDDSPAIKTENVREFTWDNCSDVVIGGAVFIMGIYYYITL